MSNKAYVCIGGPLNGEVARGDDWHNARVAYSDGYPEPTTRKGDLLKPAGMYNAWAGDYHQFNGARRTGRMPGMVYLHYSLYAGIPDD